MPNFPERAPYAPRWLLLLCLWAAGGAHALGLDSELRLYSALNQPLRAELDLYLGPGETAEEVEARLADRDSYRRLRLPYHEGLPPLTFAVSRDVTTGRPVLVITSQKPMREPALELLLEVSWGGGRMVRQYALLLDPPSMFQAPQVAPAPPPAAPTAKSARPARASASYGPVQRGETLSQIAQRLKPAGVTTAQMTVALFEANPHAFIGGNMNRLRWGATLYLPDEEGMTGYSTGEASKLMLRQQQALQERRAGAPVGGTAAAPPAADAPASAEPMLQILTPAAPDATGSELEQRLAQVRQINETVEVENEELRRRLSELEQQAQRLAEQVLSHPDVGGATPLPPLTTEEPAPGEPLEPTAPEHAPAVPVTEPAQPVTSPAMAVTAAAPALPQQAWWRNPWVWGLTLLLAGGVVLGWYLWRRSQQTAYRDLGEALRQDAEAKERARQAMLEKARNRLR